MHEMLTTAGVDDDEVRSEELAGYSSKGFR